MYTPFYIGFYKQYGPYAHFGYLTLVSDPWPNKVIQKLKSDAKKWRNKLKPKGMV